MCGYSVTAQLHVHVSCVYSPSRGMDVLCCTISPPPPPQGRQGHFKPLVHLTTPLLLTPHSHGGCPVTTATCSPATPYRTDHAPLLTNQYCSAAKSVRCSRLWDEETIDRGRCFLCLNLDWGTKARVATVCIQQSVQCCIWIGIYNYGTCHESDHPLPRTVYVFLNIIAECSPVLYMIITTRACRHTIHRVFIWQ